MKDKVKGVPHPFESTELWAQERVLVIHRDVERVATNLFGCPMSQKLPSILPSSLPLFYFRSGSPPTCVWILFLSLMSFTFFSRPYSCSSCEFYIRSLDSFHLVSGSSKMATGSKVMVPVTNRFNLWILETCDEFHLTLPLLRPFL